MTPLHYWLGWYLYGALGLLGIYIAVRWGVSHGVQDAQRARE